MIKCYLDDKTLLVQFTTTELDHHVANYIRENVDDIIMRKNIRFPQYKIYGLFRNWCYYRQI